VNGSIRAATSTRTPSLAIVLRCFTEELRLSSTPLLIYGANGYTGALIARLAVARGLRPILAGRNREAVAALAVPLGLEYRVFALEDAAALDAGLAEARVVLHCAGPFMHTSRQMADACFRTHTH
jgi:short subunit dehydrogenase-like uncharacterized protein